MKTINLKSSLSKYLHKTIRVEGKLVLFSKPAENKPHTVLISEITMDGKPLVDHMWIAYSKAWDNFSNDHLGQKFTFVTTVKQYNKGPFHKYRFGKISKLMLLATFKDLRQKTKVVEEPKVLVNPCTAKLIPLLSVGGRLTTICTGIATSITNDILEITKLDVDSTVIETISIQLSDYKLNMFKATTLPKEFSAKITFKEDLHKVLPYQPVHAVAMKNIHLTKEE